MSRVPDPVVGARRFAVRGEQGAWGERTVPEETAVAFTYNRAAYAVMMATPADLEDFGIGFSLSERVITTPADITGLEIVPSELGVEVRMEISAAAAERLGERRRHMAGPVGCGLCGLESLKDAIRAVPTITADARLTADQVRAAALSLGPAQMLNQSTHAVHAAGFWRKSLVAAREDVGRHNALDKLAGALARDGQSTHDGVVVISSRVSVEMVQKAAVMGAPVLIAVSAPTALAIRTADDAGLTLVAVAREDGFEVFTHAERIL